MDIEGVKMKDLKVVFMGTPQFSVPLLEALITNCTVIGVVTQPDKQVGKEVKPSPIKEVALQHDIKVLQPEKIKNDYEGILALKPDIIITCAYGQIIPKAILDAPRYKCINVHASLLPKLRGGAPIHHAIIDGYSKTGITIMYMSEKMDTGDIISRKETTILPIDNVGTLHDRLSLIGRDLLLETLPDIMSGNIHPINQKEAEATYAWNIKREDEKVDFSKSKREVFNQIRGLNPWPGAYTVMEGKIYKVWNSREGIDGYNERLEGEIMHIYDDGIGVKTGSGEIIITEIQIEGKKRVEIKEYLNGLQNKESLIGKMFE